MTVQSSLSQKANENYDFINAIRCIAMMSIVAEHCIVTGGSKFIYESPLYFTYLTVMQATKFGTISFFLIAGFLLGDKFPLYSPGQYLKRRFETIFGPWVFWSLVYVLIDMLYRKIGFTFHNVFFDLKNLYLYSNYWFIINFMISITLLSAFRRYLYSISFGVILAIFTLFYSINVHYEWIKPNHTTAVLGFVFFLWVGAQIRQYWTAVDAWIQKTSYAVLIPITLIAFGLAATESMVLYQKSIDASNTLRFSNILYSVSMFMLLLKIRHFKFVNYLKPRQTTYGIYLIHFIPIVFLLPLIFGTVKAYQLSVLEYLGYKGTCFLIIYTLVYSLALFISQTRLRKLIGA